MKITEHVVDRYIERFKPGRVPTAKYRKFIKSVLFNHLDEKVQSMNKDGAFRIRDHIYVIVRNQTAITVFSKDFEHNDFVPIAEVEEAEKKLQKERVKFRKDRLKVKDRQVKKVNGACHTRKRRGSRKGLWNGKGN